MILQLVESDRPKTFLKKLAEYTASPPKPILRFYGPIDKKSGMGKRHILFSVRNGVLLPLLYSVTIKVNYYGFTDYCRKDDHIGPFSVDDWRLTLENIEPGQLTIILGIVPFEITTDTMMVAI